MPVAVKGGKWEMGGSGNVPEAAAGARGKT